MKSLFIVGNWKSNKTIRETKEWVQGFMAHGSWLLTKPSTLTVVVCAPFTALSTLKQGVQDNNLPIGLGAQDLSKFDMGAYTGDINANMVKELADWVIIGHSERRTNHKESDPELAIKVTQANNAGLRVIYCVPDATTLVPRNVDIVAYEPVWAIGTGTSDTPENAQGVCAQIKQTSGVKIVIYGGSVTAGNVASFCAMQDIDGVLPGGASLNPEKFTQLLIAAQT